MVIRALLLVAPVAAACAWPAAAQTIEERAAQVRELMQAPQPVETVIDRGTRVIGRPPVAATTTSPLNRADPRLTTEGVQLDPKFLERMNRLLSAGSSGVQMDYSNTRGTSTVDNPGGTALKGAPQGPGATWLKDYAPGVLVIHRPNDGHVGGTANLSTGVPVPGAAP